MAGSNGKNGKNGNGELGRNVSKEALKEERRRIDWELNHQKIVQAYMTLFAAQKRVPTQIEIAKACNLSRNAVGRHVGDMKLNDVLPNIKLRTERVLHGLTSRAEKGYAQEVELWLQLVYGWVRKIGLQHSGGIKYESPKSEVKDRIARLISAVEAGDASSN